jgi:hypothetical protein
MPTIQHCKFNPIWWCWFRCFYQLVFWKISQNLYHLVFDFLDFVLFLSYLFFWITSYIQLEPGPPFTYDYGNNRKDLRFQCTSLVTVHDNLSTIQLALFVFPIGIGLYCGCLRTSIKKIKIFPPNRPS